MEPFYNPQIKGRRLTNWELVVSHESREDVLKECHDDPKSAHLRVQKTIDRVVYRDYWPGVSKDVKMYVKNAI